jgi:plasmid stabilization system protein ParE
MSYSLKITLRAKKSLEQNLDYLIEEWGSKVTSEFIDRVEYVYNTLRDDPYLYPFYSPSKNIRRCILHKRIILFYRISNKAKVSILLSWNTAQNPDKLKL